MSKIKIVSDSSSDVISISDVSYATAPLKIITDEKQYVDNAELNAEQMATDLLSYNGRSTTSCPSPEDWLFAFGDAEEIICITMTALLSGTYNTACIAKQIYEEKNPGRRVCVINSRSTGPEMALMIERIREMILNDASFDDVCSAIDSYHTELLFVLSSMKNLANNGRVNKVAAKLAGILGIRAIGKASEEGVLEMLDKVKGEANTVEAMLGYMKKNGYNGGRVNIAHCLNEGMAEKMKNVILTAFPNAQTAVYKLRGLCSFYAEKGGMLVGFEA